MQRYALRDDEWARIKDFLPGREGHGGGTAMDNRLFAWRSTVTVMRAWRRRMGG